ncbi:hypothetical protein Glove_74g36 [Diversispora epigaea]|uniref:Uncharacterized protein n=1 Tax=Diversispora epigaea TaxID=1348612 RepID=A0A397JIZ5_9GLOM|nr:hypothetical protein Glove_74g36 [Diversispora epigaea]
MILLDNLTDYYELSSDFEKYIVQRDDLFANPFQDIINDNDVDNNDNNKDNINDKDNITEWSLKEVIYRITFSRSRIRLFFKNDIKKNIKTTTMLTFNSLLNDKNDGCLYPFHP